MSDANKAVTQATDRCVNRVWPPSKFMESHRCNRKAGHGPNGDLCWQHAKPKVERIPLQFKLDDMKNQEIASLKSTIDTLTAENEKLRGLCGEAADHLRLDASAEWDLSDKLRRASRGEI